MSKKLLKPYVRYDANWQVIPGSLVMRTSKPKDGNWGELHVIPSNTTSTTTTLKK